MQGKRKEEKQEGRRKGRGKNERATEVKTLIGGRKKRRNKKTKLTWWNRKSGRSRRSKSRN